MSRTNFYRALYFAEVIGGAALFLAAIFHFQLSPVKVALLVVCLLIPGRVLGFFWRDLLRGLRLLKAKEFAESKRHSELFLATVRRKPWLKKLIWLGSGTYSRDAEAMVLSNLGAAEIALGELTAARGHLEESMAIDKQNPLPPFNMGVLLRAAGHPEEAISWFQEARRLGYSKSVIARIVESSQTRFANMDGRGRS